MASSSALQTSFSLPLGIKTSNQPSNENHLAAIGTRINFNSTTSRRYRVLAAAGGGEETQKKERAEAPGVDTRIHWDDPDEGWVGGDNNTNDNGNSSTNAKESRWNRFERFSDLLDDLSDSHYQFLGVPAEADMEEIKAAYRRLSKEYHPDTTSLPIKTASEKFMRLREIYDVLSDQEKRKFYDWTLAQEVASRQAEKMMRKFEDPYQQEVRNYKPKPDIIDRLDGRNLQLSDQARAALGFDILVITFAICCFVYVLYFKEPY